MNDYQERAATNLRSAAACVSKANEAADHEDYERADVLAAVSRAYSALAEATLELGRG